MNFSIKNSYSSMVILSVILGLILALILFLGFFIEKKKNAYIAEASGKSITLSISQETVILEESTSAKENVTTTENNKQPSPTVEKNESTEDPALADQKYFLDKRPKIALIIGGIGLSKSETKAALALKAEVTLGLSPYASDINKLSNDAASLGHEILINIPLEPINYPDDNPGPLGLIGDLPDDENIKRLQFILSIANNSGIYSVDNEKFSRSVVITRQILDLLAKQNKIFLYDIDNGNNYLRQISEREGFKLLLNDAIIDSELSEEKINNKLFIFYKL